MECCTYRQCSSVIWYTVDGMWHIQAMFVLLYATQLMECCHIQAMLVCYMLHSWWNIAHTCNVRLLYATQLMECCTYRQCSSALCYTVDGMLHIQAMLVCYMLHSWWNVAHPGNVRLLYATQLMECCTYRQCLSVIRYIVDGILHILEMFICYMLHSWWNVAHTQLMECCTYRQCSSVICYRVDGMLHIQAMFIFYMLHSWWNVAHTGNVRLLYATQLMECLHIQAMLVCYMLHSWWDVAHTGNVRLLYATQLMECCTYKKCTPLSYTVDAMCRQCSSVICYMECTYSWCYTVEMLHMQAMFVCYMLHSWWNVAHRGNVPLSYVIQLMEYCTHRQGSSVIR